MIAWPVWERITETAPGPIDQDAPELFPECVGQQDPARTSDGGPVNEDDGSAITDLLDADLVPGPKPHASVDGRDTESQPQLTLSLDEREQISSRHDAPEDS